MVALGRVDQLPAPAPSSSDEAIARSDGHLAETRISREAHGGALLVSDWGMVFALLNHGRRLAVARMFGLQGRDADIATLIGLALMTRLARDRAHRLSEAASPSGPDVFLGFSAVREAVVSIAGPVTRQTPGVPGLIMIGVVGAAAGPAVSKAMKRARGTSQRMNTGFHHRYGYLVDPGQRRQSRADRREGKTGNLIPVRDGTAADQ